MRRRAAARKGLLGLREETRGKAGNKPQLSLIDVKRARCFVAAPSKRHSSVVKDDDGGLNFVGTDPDTI